MSYLYQKCKKKNKQRKKIGVIDFVPEINRVKNYLDFENWRM